MKRNLKTIAIALTLALALSPLSLGSKAFAIQESGTKQQYVILTRNATATQAAISNSDIEEVSVQDSAPDILVADLTSSEAENLYDEDEVVTVEENIIFTADTEAETEQQPTEDS